MKVLSSGRGSQQGGLAEIRCNQWVEAILVKTPRSRAWITILVGLVMSRQLQMFQVMVRAR